jgi:hypothetical protein
MTEISGMPSFGGVGLSYVAPASIERQEIPRIEPTASSGTATDARDDLFGGAGSKQDQRPEAKQSLYKEKLDEDTITGPPPTFQITLLQLESALQSSIATIEASRGTNEAAQASEVKTAATEIAAPKDQNAPESAAESVAGLAWTLRTPYDVEASADLGPGG